jgi:replicative DNA helicase
MIYDLEIRNILEKEVLSSLLNNSELFFTKKHSISIDDFNLPQHKLIYSAVLKSIEDFNTVSLVTVRQSVKNLSEGDLSTNDVISLMGTYRSLKGKLFDKHCELLFQYNISDTISLIASEMKSTKKENLEDFEGRINSWKAELNSLGQNLITDMSLEDSVDETIKSILSKINNDQLILGVSSGTPDLNHFTSGWLQPDLIVLAGRPGMGKSAFAIFNCKENAMKKDGAAFFSYEMPNSQILERMAASMVKMNSKKMLKGELSNEEWLKVEKALLYLKTLPLHLIDKPLPLSKLLNHIRYLVFKNDVKIVYIDYVQLIPNNLDKTFSDDVRIGGISRRLKLLALELGIPIVLLSQLSRAVEGRTGVKIPVISDLRGSGSLEQDADVIGFFYRPDYYNTTSSKFLNNGNNLCQFIIAKGRRIGTGTFNLFYRLKYNYFEDWDNDHVKHF